jgi:hypothetical protein
MKNKVNKIFINLAAGVAFILAGCGTKEPIHSASANADSLASLISHHINDISFLDSVRAQLDEMNLCFVLETGEDCSIWKSLQTDDNNFDPLIRNRDKNPGQWDFFVSIPNKAYKSYKLREVKEGENTLRFELLLYTNETGSGATALGAGQSRILGQISSDDEKLNVPLLVCELETSADDELEPESDATLAPGAPKAGRKLSKGKGRIARDM